MQYMRVCCGMTYVLFMDVRKTTRNDLNNQTWKNNINVRHNIKKKKKQKIRRRTSAGWMNSTGDGQTGDMITHVCTCVMA